MRAVGSKDYIVGRSTAASSDSINATIGSTGIVGPLSESRLTSVASSCLVLATSRFCCLNYFFPRIVFKTNDLIYMHQMRLYIEISIPETLCIKFEWIYRYRDGAIGEVGWPRSRNEVY